MYILNKIQNSLIINKIHSFIIIKVLMKTFKYNNQIKSILNYTLDQYKEFHLKYSDIIFEVLLNCEDKIFSINNNFQILSKII